MMPIFHDNDEPPPRPSASQPSSSSQIRRVTTAEHSLERTQSEHVQPRVSLESVVCPTLDHSAINQHHKPTSLDRVELIERLKRSNSPSLQQPAADGRPSNASPEPRPHSRNRPRTPRLSSHGSRNSRPSTPDPLRDHAAAGLEIERPRSALHSGDFREKKEERKAEDVHSTSNIPLATSPVAPWHTSFPASARPPSREQSPFPFHDRSRLEFRTQIRSRAVSQSSYASPFVFMPPTSPLVQQSNNTDLDSASRPGSRHPSRSPERGNRRHTFSPHSFQAFQSSPMARSASGLPGGRSLKREGTYPYQAHQPRRSLSSFNQLQPRSSPQTPFHGGPRTLLPSDASPLQHAPMVGSYEESILRGRMSTTPSRPLNFVAQIGVLGFGHCKANLKCPPHVTVPFPAVFYSYSGGNGRISDDSPSPYVGLVDLENSLPHPSDRSDSKMRRRRTIPDADQDDFDMDASPRDNPAPSSDHLRRREKKKRRSGSPKAPPGGSYRIPPKGQVQIVLKNPNKTAVKLFLVPYDVTDMEPGQKTFVRQRSYSAGPILDMPLSSRNNLGTDRPEAALSNSEDPNDRPVLRYLIHLHICCPSKGRYYLYKSVRVVFANRVPDGKEKLRNEIQMPEPRYSTYKPTRDPPPSQLGSSAGAQLTAEKAMRRRSAGVTLSQQAYDRMDGLSPRPHQPPPAVQLTGGTWNQFASPVSAVEPIPFSLGTRHRGSTTSTWRPTTSETDMSMEQDPFFSTTSTLAGSSSSPNHTELFEKLSRGDPGYGGNMFGVPSTSDGASHGAGLLARRLRGLDVETGEDNTFNTL